MEALKFADSHNIVAYLEKSTENANFDEIVDFLTASPIRYSLTISSTIYVSYIEQFWSTVKIKIVNNQTQIHAKVNGKTIVLTKSSVRRDLYFDDEDAVFNDEYDTPSHTKKVFANMRRQGKDFSGTVTPLFPSMLASQAVEGEETQGRYGHDFKVNTASTSIATTSINITTAEPVTTASAPVTTVDVSVSTAEPSTPPTITILIEDEDLTISQTLMKMRSVESKEKSKEKGVSSETTIRPIRGEPEKPVKVKGKDQIAFDEEVARSLEAHMQAKYEEEERVAIQREEDDNLISWDNTQAMMEADYELAQRLQAEEQGELTIKERSKLFVELMDKRNKHFAKLRAEEIRRKPPTKAQKRNQMCTYLKNMDNYKHSQLKNKSFKEIQNLFDNTIKWVDSFVPMDSEVVEGCKSQAEGSKKRTRKELDEESVKRQKLKDDAEKAKLKACLEIVPGDVVTIESLATKYLIIDWKTHILAEDKMYYQIIRAGGSAKFYKIFSAILDDFDKQDMLDLYRLVKERFKTTSLEGYDRLLWGDLITLFEPSEKDEIWKA
ncbi:hypothetical protein Tco_1047799 [Tanacetum coccineum]